MGRHRRQFSPEFKRDAVELVRSSGRPVAQVARELGCGESSLSLWMANDRIARVVGQARSGCERRSR